MDSITLAPEKGLPASLEDVDAYSVYAAFEKITDGRCKRGIRYPAALILTLIVLAKLMGEPKLSGVSQWVRLRGTWLNEVLHLQRPCWPAGLPPRRIRMCWSAWMSEARDAGDAGVLDASRNESALWGGTQSFSDSSRM